MSLTSEIEEKMSLKIDSLNALEKETYFKMLETVQKAQMTPEKLKQYIVSMRDAVAKELINEPEFNRVFIFRINFYRLWAVNSCFYFFYWEDER